MKSIVGIIIVIEPREKRIKIYVNLHESSSESRTTGLVGELYVLWITWQLMSFMQLFSQKFYVRKKKEI